MGRSGVFYGGSFLAGDEIVGLRNRLRHCQDMSGRIPFALAEESGEGVAAVSRLGTMGVEGAALLADGLGAALEPLLELFLLLVSVKLNYLFMVIEDVVDGTLLASKDISPGRDVPPLGTLTRADHGLREVGALPIAQGEHIAVVVVGGHEFLRLRHLSYNCQIILIALPAF